MRKNLASGWNLSDPRAFLTKSRSRNAQVEASMGSRPPRTEHSWVGGSASQLVAWASEARGLATVEGVSILVTGSCALHRESVV
jgi:hypothetical protein